MKGGLKSFKIRHFKILNTILIEYKIHSIKIFIINKNTLLSNTQFIFYYKMILSLLVANNHMILLMNTFHTAWVAAKEALKQKKKYKNKMWEKNNLRNLKSSLNIYTALTPSPLYPPHAMRIKNSNDKREITQ